MPTVNIPGVGELRLEQLVAPAVGVISVIALVLGLVFGLKDTEGSSTSSGEEATVTTTTSAEPAPSQPTTTTEAAAPSTTTEAAPPTTEAPAPVVPPVDNPRPTLAENAEVDKPALEKGASRQEELGLSNTQVSTKGNRFGRELFGKLGPNKNFLDASLLDTAKQELDKRELIDFSAAKNPNRVQEIELVSYLLEDGETIVHLYRVDLGYVRELKGNIFNDTAMGGDWLKNVNYNIAHTNDENYYYVTVVTAPKRELDIDPEKAKTGVDVGLRVVGGILDFVGVPMVGGILKQVPTDWITKVATPTPAP